VVIPSCGGPAVELVVAWKREGRLPPARTILPPSAYPAGA
jgi:hypothetical protein